MPASTISIESLFASINTTPVNVKPLAERIRTRGKEQDAWVAEALDKLGSGLNKVTQSIRNAPKISKLKISSLDFTELIVGGESGPGELTVLGGGPDFAEVGFVGTRDSGVTVAITSVNNATVTTTAPHLKVAGDRILILDNTSLVHLGYWRVATTPTPTTLTLADPPTGTGTGGTLSKQWRGARFETISIGGTDFDDALLYIDSLGNLFINDALITLFGSAATIVLDPTVGEITLTGTDVLPTQITLSAVGIDVSDTLGNYSVMPAGELFVNRSVADLTGGNIRFAGYTGGATAGGPVLYFDQSRGTEALPTATQLNDPLAAIWGNGTAVTAFDKLGAARMTFRASQAFTAIAAGARIVFSTVPIGSTAAVDRWTITDIGTLLPAAGRDIGDNANPVQTIWTADINIGAFAKFNGLTASRPMLTDASKIAVSGKIDLADTTHIENTLGEGFGGTGAITFAAARSNLQVYSSAEVDNLLSAKADLVHGHSGTTDPGGADSHVHGVSVS